MQPARSFGVSGRRHAFGHCGSKCDYVVLHFGLDLADSLDIEAGVPAEQPCCLRGHDAQIGKRFGGRELDFEPLPKLILIAPDAAHLGARVACNHTGLELENL